MIQHKYKPEDRWYIVKRSNYVFYLLVFLNISTVQTKNSATKVVQNKNVLKPWFSVAIDGGTTRQQKYVHTADINARFVKSWLRISKPLKQKLFC